MKAAEDLKIAGLTSKVNGHHQTGTVQNGNGTVTLSSQPMTNGNGHLSSSRYDDYKTVDWYESDMETLLGLPYKALYGK